MAEEKNDDQILIRLPKNLKMQLETAARVEGTTVQDWVRKAMVNRISLLNVCPVCGTVNSGTAKFCNECGASLKDSKRAMYFEWMKDLLKEALEEGRDLDAVLAYLEDPAGEQAKLEKKGKTIVRTEVKK
ncbi:MAG: zinc ribbon domain-containing protein [Methanocorpusculum sp.]|uniref:zinc ribbon domain-containing protein n=1 Tax=Methanocorpusculum sp. TaxID=2058474 RepID=UPI00271CD57B|nr:zinc ribbon domain-containing protein [Methanocorpusculum sp.]MDO9522742.1 zinc ribbon domain-containing protein [Methanocorpusculum sp.]